MTGDSQRVDCVGHATPRSRVCFQPAEKAYLANCDRIEVDGEILYNNRSAPGGEPCSLADHGERIFCEVWRSFTGYEFDAPEILQIPGSDFWLNNDEEEFLRRKAMSRRPWWKLF